MSTTLLDMVDLKHGGSVALRFIPSVSTVENEASKRRLTQRRVIDFKRHAAARCRCC